MHIYINKYFYFYHISPTCFGVLYTLSSGRISYYLHQTIYVVRAVLYVTLVLYPSFATGVSQLKICDFSGENFKGFEVLQYSMCATTTQLLSSGEFCKLRYDTLPANVSFYTNNSKMPNSEL